MKKNNKTNFFSVTAVFVIGFFVIIGAGVMINTVIYAITPDPVIAEAEPNTLEPALITKAD